MRNKGIRYLGSLLLVGALAAPLALTAQDRDQRHDKDNRAQNQRVYDREHKDYHEWNADEQQHYREWYDARYRGKKFREYRRLNKKDQEAYWKWRHQRGDRDDRRSDRDDHR